MMIQNILLTAFSKMNEILNSVNLGHIVIHKIFSTTADTLFAWDDCAFLVHVGNELSQLIQGSAQAPPSMGILSCCAPLHVHPVRTQLQLFFVLVITCLAILELHNYMCGSLTALQKWQHGGIDKVETLDWIALG